MPDISLTKRRILILVKVFIKTVPLLLCFFCFICSLDLLSTAFELLGGKLIRHFFYDGSILYNPVAAFLVGLLVTVAVQSSSVSTSILVSLVSSSVLTVETAIPMVMGANVGTAITNTLVALMYAGVRDEFGRAFAGATVHGMFNWLTVLVLMPLEVITGLLFSVSKKVIPSLKIKSGEDIMLLKPIIDLFTNYIIQVDDELFNQIASGHSKGENKSLIMIWCKYLKKVTLKNVTVPSPENCTSPTLCWTTGDMTWTLMNITYKENVTKYFPFPFGWVSGYLAIIFGAVMTFVVQSSSVFTSTIIPLVGTEVISLERAYPLILGSNIGTTTTAILAALASPASTLQDSLQIALCHLFFNIFGVLLWYPIPFLRLPIYFAESLGETITTYRWFAIVYVVFCFLVGPILAFCLSIARRSVLLYVGLPLYFVPFLIVYLHTFNVLKLFPLWIRDLKPWDDLITSIMIQCQHCKNNLKRRKKSNPNNIEGKTLPQ
ncbi:sodium-dependent phosphate transport protein 2B-like isoform X2 [Monodelphis domestica]|uniref:sodium-dependent phosphate transport protein 2B-like isoform X2 n=1 Tax=Monodelphis domestica TaxID=13616 RepID=UPI00044362C6|nr:sodium-dependent phosphate transport protein 2B-like isoform X2 [Monodelphis domestica]